MANASLQVTPEDVGGISVLFLSYVSFPIYFQILSCSTLLQFVRVKYHSRHQCCSMINSSKIAFLCLALRFYKEPTKFEQNLSKSGTSKNTFTVTDIGKLFSIGLISDKSWT